MHITIEHFPGDRPSFNVNFHSKEGAAVFFTVKGCRVTDGSKGRFISWPATKNEKTGKWWNHCFSSDAFTSAVVKAVEESKPAPDKRTLKEMRQEGIDDIPF